MDTTYIYFLLYIIGIVTFGVLVMVLGSVHEKKTIGAHNGFSPINQKKREELESAKAKIILLLKDKKQITNNDVEVLLGVSDATATRYLQSLEEEEKIRQQGTEGRSVIYTFK